MRAAAQRRYYLGAAVLALVWSLSPPAFPQADAPTTATRAIADAPTTAPVAAPARLRYLFPLDAEGLGGWCRDLQVQQAEGGLLAGDAATTLTVERREDGRRVLALGAEFPRPAGLLREVRGDREAWAAGRMFRAEIRVPPDAQPYPSVQLVAYHPVWGWFSNEPTRPLTPGQWTSVFWMLGENASDWASMDKPMAWNNTIRNGITQVGLRFFCTGRSAGKILLADLAIDTETEATPPLEVTRVEWTKNDILRGRRFELSFDLSRSYDNPFDPAQVAVDVDFFVHGDAPPGEPGTLSPADLPGPGTAATSLTLPAFYYQDFLRQLLPNGQEEVYQPRGRACWKARFLPVADGLHSFRIRVRDHRGGTYVSPLRPFNVKDAPFKGFIRVDPADPRYLSFDDGSFFYPVGMVVRSPWDRRCTYPYEFETPYSLGTHAYDLYFGSMAKAGMNFSRVWMSAWWTAPEWSKGYRSDYQGLGRYSLLNGWRQDYVLELAEREGIYIDLTLHNHGMLNTSGDSEWSDNPLSTLQGGALKGPGEFFTSPVARLSVRNRLRYVIARWGYSPAIAWFLLFNEVNLVGNYNSNNIRDWDKEMADYLKANDPYRHLVSTHVIYRCFDKNVHGQPCIEVKQSNGYSDDAVGAALALYDQLSAYKLPAYINEYGVGSTRASLRLNLHGEMWASSVLPFCGPALYWYWPHVQFGNEYYQYENLLAFHRGEDYRTLGLQKAEKIAVRSKDSVLEAVGQQSRDRAYLWVYDKRLFRSQVGLNPNLEEFKDAPLSIDGLSTGTYRVQFWDTWAPPDAAAAPPSRVRLTTGSLTLKTPAFKRDIALKLQRVGD